MLAHVRANLWLLALTVLLCTVAYPLSLWGVGQVAFPEQANGSLLRGADGRPIASRLIAHEVKAAAYFQPRPSAASYNAAASGASNLAASNPNLRQRVARSLGPLVRYADGARRGQPVAPDVIRWARSQPGAADKQPADQAAELFERWRDVHPDVALQDVPADLVTASASGLDPHITLDGALYQLPGVADQWAERTGQDPQRLRDEIRTLLEQSAHAPLLGLVGARLVNVVEFNLELHRRYGAN
jgi:K+-transporting ATPase ATPase C chain